MRSAPQLMMKSKFIVQPVFILLISGILIVTRSLQLEDDASTSSDCQTPQMLSNGHVSCVDVHISGSTTQLLCTYTCNSGYKFQGSTDASISRLCSNGVFSDGSDPPQCVSVCNGPELPPFVTLTCVPKTDSLTQTGSLTCKAGCQPSYKLATEPEGNYVCQTGGSWFPDLSSIPKCVHSQEAALNSELAVCTTWGQDHYRTFDNNIYTFKGHCKYVLAYVPNTFSIMVDNGQTCTNSVNCKRNIMIFIGDNNLALKSTNNGTVVLWNNAIFPVPGSQAGTVIEKVGSYITVRSSLKFSLKWDGSQSVFIKASDELKGQISGLCGRFNGDPTDDFENEKGNVVTSVVSFASSWKKTELDDETCTDEIQMIGCPEYTAQKSTVEVFADSRCQDLIKDHIFKKCHGIVDTGPYIQACKEDCCEHNSSECMCETMEAYSRACLDHGIELTWRRPGRCEIHCVGGMVYKECGSSCIPDCLNLDAVCSDPTCVDGCFCPDGWVLHKEKCIESNKCPCTHGNREYQQGSLINEECNSCSCMSGRWNCTHKECDAVCSVMGDPHYSTFDGRRYDFMGLCSYYMVQTPDFNIVIDNIRCGFAEATCTKSMSINFKELIVNLDHNHQLIINGKEVTKLPYQTGIVQISMISSLFMQVVLSNGVSVMWDGHTRAYIKVPPSLKGQTLGLCGTYDGKQNNDFLTPQGSIETNPNLFGNQWKITKDCDDMPLTIATPPCETQSQRKIQAAQLCDQLKSSLFEACHDFEDVTQYYTDCMYDLCSCAENIQDCLCPSLGTYADSCALKGVKINWRLQVKECMLQCPGGQVYQVCSKPCEYTCYALAQNTDSLCDLKCVEGCSCPEGQLLNEDNECVPAEKCPCMFDGHEYPAGFTTMKGTDLCVCTDAQWQCSRIRAGNLNITNVQPLCPDNMEYSLCDSDCHVTCENIESALTCPKETVCKPGCICKDGYVFDGNKCILSSMCPCYHGGQAYFEGDKFFIDCNECICKNQRWQCEKNDCPSTCSAYGDSHYTTFDGRKFEFQGSCDYIMAKSNTDNPNKFLITTTNLECGTTGVTCSKGIEFISGVEGTSSFYRLQFIRGKTVKPDPGSPFKVKEVGEMVYVSTPFGVTIQWDKGTRVYIRLSIEHINKVEGLCGNFNGDQNDDFQTRSGGLSVAKVTSFGDSWRVHSTCETSREVVNTCLLAPQRKSWAQHRCAVLASDLFQPCHALVEPKEYIERCEFDACGCDMGGDCECLCTAIAAYAHECANKGMPIKWRSKDLCGLTCADCKEYNPCISLCPKKTCDNRYNYSKILESCVDEDMCFEGCDLHPCPDGQVYGSIVEPITCVPEHFCITQTCNIDGKKYWEGERIYNPLVCRSECEICNCRNGEVEHITLGATCFTYTTKYSPLTTVITKSTSPTITCTQSGWTSFMSASVPTHANVGDRESVAGLRERYSFCDGYQIIGIRCRVIGQPEYEQYFGQILTCDLESGLTCYHKDQVGGLCLDYEISFKCDCSKEALTTGKTTSTTSTTTVIVTQPPVKMCNWTQWMNSYRPTSLGDIESMSNLRFEYSFCAYPSSIVCRTVPDYSNPQGLSYDQAKQMAVTCDLNRGLVCLNSVQSSGQSCHDYEVAVKCEDGCAINETTQTTPPVTGVRNTTLSFDRTSPSLSTNSPSTIGVLSTTSSSTYQSVSTYHNTNYTVQSSAFSTTLLSTGTKIQQTTTMDSSTVISKSSPLTYEPSTINYWVTSASDHASSASTLHLSSDNLTKRTTWHDTVTSSIPTATNDLSSETTSSDYTPCPQLSVEENKECELVGIFDKYVVDNNQLEASSSADAAFDAKNGRLMNTASGPTNGGAWMPRDSDLSPHLVIDLEDLHEVAGVATQGRPDFPEWVKSYMVYFSNDGVNFIPYNACGTDQPKIFLANNDSNTIAKVFFDRKIFSRRVAIYPIEYVNAIALRADLIRCDDVVTTSLETHTSTPATSTSRPYSTFPSVHADTKSTGLPYSTSKYVTTVNTEEYPSTSLSSTLTPSTKDTSTSYQLTSSSSPRVSTNESSAPTTAHFQETTSDFMSTSPVKCTKSHWLPLINRNIDVVTEGDRENLSADELTRLCDGGIVTKIKCYDSDGIPAAQTGEIVKCDLENGLTCNNSENQHVCKDYSITYWCECKQVTVSQTVTTYSPFVTETSVKPMKSTTELHTNVTSTAAPTTNSTTASSTSAHAQSSSTSVHATSSAIKTEPTGTPSNCISVWSSWINRNVPTFEHGEHEMMSDEEKIQFCPRGRITTIDCESESGMKDESDHHVCTIQDGLICTNLEPIPGLDMPVCLDYKVKYYCECEGVTIQEQQSSSTTQKMTVQCGWSPWLSADEPFTSASDSGDLETIEALKSKFSICPNMMDIECRVAGTSTSAMDSGQAGVKCDINNGLRCYNTDIVNGVCYDYEVRVLCWDDTACRGISTPTPVEVTTPVYSTHLGASTTVVCLPGKEWSPCAYKCKEVCHFMGHVTGACSEKSLEMCVPGCKSLSSVESVCSKGQRLLNLYSCVDTVACTCLKPDGTVARPFESWADPNSKCSKCSCFNNEVICNSEYECTTEETSPTVTQSLPCAWSSWINNDKPDTGSGDSELVSALYTKYGLCAAPIAVECRDANTLQDVHLSGQQVTCTEIEGLRCLNANNGDRCKDYEIRVFCPCQPNTTVTDSTSLSSDLSSLFHTSSSVPSSTSLPMHTNSEGVPILTMQSTASDSPTSRTFPTQFSTDAPSSHLQRSSDSSLPPSTKSSLSSDSSAPSDASSDSSAPPDVSISSYQTSSIASNTRQSDSTKSSKSSDSSTAQPTTASTSSTRQSYISSSKRSPTERVFTSSSQPATQTNESTGYTFTTHSIATVKMCGWTDWMNDHPLDALGDMEAVSQLRKAYIFCESSAILSMRCRDIKTKKSPEELGQSQVLCDLRHGLVCINSVQPLGLCADYEVSFLCDPLGSGCLIKTSSTTEEIEITHVSSTTDGPQSTVTQTSERGTAQTTKQVTSKTTERGTAQTTEKGIDKTTERDTAQTTERGTDKTTERGTDKTTEKGTGQTTERGTDKTTEKGRAQTTASSTAQTTEKGTAQTTASGTALTTERDTAQTTEKGRAQTTEKGRAQTTERDTDQTTERGRAQTTASGTAQTTEKDRAQTTERGIAETTERDTAQTTERGTGQTTGRDTDKTTEIGTDKITKRGIAQTTASGTAHATERGTAQTTERGTAQTTERGIAQTTERGTGQTTGRDTDKTTERGTDKTTERGTDKTTARGTDKTTVRGTVQTTERDTDKTTDKTTDRGTDKTTDRGTDKTTERGTDQTTERGTDKTTVRGTYKTTERGTDKTTERGTDKTTERGTDKTTARSTDKTTDKITKRGIAHTTERGTAQTTERGIAQTTERGTGQTTGRDTAQTTGRDTAQTTERGTDKTTERGTDKTTERGTDKTTERGTDNTTARGTDKTTVRGTDKTTVRGTVQTTERGTDKTTERGTAQTTERDTDKTTDRGTDKTTDRGTDKTTERGTDKTTERGTARTTERDTARTTERGIAQTTERGTGRDTAQTTERGTGQTTERGTGQTTGRDTAQTTERGTGQTTERGTAQTTERDTAQTTARDTAQTTERGIAQTTERGTGQTTGRDTAQTTGRDTAQTTERGTDKTTERGTDKTTERGTDKTTERGTDNTTARGTDKTTVRGTDKTTVRGTVQTTERGTDKTTERGTARTTERDTARTTERGIAQTTERGTGRDTAQTTERGTGQTTERGTGQTTGRDTAQTTERGTGQTTERGTAQTTERDTAQTTARDTAQTTERGTAQTTARGTDQTTERVTAQTTARDTSQTSEKDTVQTTGINKSYTTQNSTPHTSSTLSQSISTRIYQSTKGGTLESTHSTLFHTTSKFDQITTDRISQPYQDSTSSSHSSSHSRSGHTTPETSGTASTLSIIPRVCVYPLTSAESQYVLDSSRSASSSLSQYSGPERSRIDSKADNLYTGAWIPLYNSNKQWISITFHSSVVVTGITTQGRHGVSEWVKTYTVLYSLDGVQFYNLLRADGQSTVFTGNADSDTKKTERVKPTEVLVVKLQPETWEKRISLRFELVGCLSPSTVTQPQMVTSPQPKTCVSVLCEQNMGLENMRVRDDMITASSFRDTAHLPSHARLGGTRSWMPSVSDTSPYIQVNLMTSQLISGVTTQGRADAPLFVLTFKVNYSADGILWNPYREIRGQDKIFYANWDSTTPVRQLFKRLVQAQHIRIIPQSWNNDIAFRFEIHGCLNTSFSYPSIPHTNSTTTTTTTTTTTARYHESTNVPKVAVTAGITNCTEWDQWLDLNHPNLTNRDEIEPIDDLIANSLLCKVPMAIDCQPEHTIRPQTNSAIISCNLWEGFKCLVSDGNEPMCNNYKVRLGCLKETPECNLKNHSLVPVCYPGLNTQYCPNTCQQGFYCNGTHCVPKSACPCSLNDQIVPPDGIQRNENCAICKCLNGEMMCAPVSQCPMCTEGIFYHNTSTCDCQCLTCKPHEFQCGDGSCIAAEKRCNCIIECIDDELGCDSTTMYTPFVTSETTTVMSTTISVPETSTPTSEVLNCSFSHTSMIENGLTIQLSVPHEKVYEVGERWSDGLCKSCLCANGTERTSQIICTKQECSLCKRGEDRKQTAGLCCGKCVKRGCVVDGQIFKAGEVLPQSKKCYTTTCEKSIFGEDFIIQESQISCENVGNLPYCQPDINITESYDSTGCCLKCLPRQNSSESTCLTCSTQLVAGNPNDTIGHFQVALDTGVLCLNQEPVPLKKCDGYCSSTSLYTDMLKGFQSSCSCCQPNSTVPISVKLHCSDGQDIMKDYIVPKECACMPCSGGT